MATNNWVEYEIIKSSIGGIRVKKIRKDGNCLFRAIAHQMYGGDPHEARYMDYIMDLRRQVAEHIGNHKDKFLLHIVENKENRAQGNEIIFNKFLEDIQKEGEWGGEEVMEAIARIHNVTIEVFMEGKGGTIFNQGADTNRNLRLAYRRGDQVHNHYDSIIDMGELELKEGGERVLSEGGNEKTSFESQMGINYICSAQGVGYTVAIRELQEERCRAIVSTVTDNVKIATWNVSGCLRKEKKEIIDDSLNILGIEVAALQETHIGNGNVETENYLWWTAGESINMEHRGVALIKRKDSQVVLSNFKGFSGSVCSARIAWGKHELTLVTVHLGCESDKNRKRYREELNRAIIRADAGRDILILGDLNAHFGTQDLENEEKEWIGPQLGHERTNENGKFIKTLIKACKFTLHNSWSTDKSVRDTWRRGQSRSQLDHILSSLNREAIKYIKAKWINKVVDTDHKLLHGVIMGGEIKDHRALSLNSIKGVKRRWVTTDLDIPSKKDHYQMELLIKMQEEDTTSDYPATIEGKWKLMEKRIKTVAGSILRGPRSPMTPRRRKTKADQQKLKYLRCRLLNDSTVRHQLKIANAKRGKAEREHFITKCEEFVKKHVKMHPATRLKELYRMIKQYKRENDRTKQKYIPMYKWEEVLEEESGEHITPIEETDNVELPPPPSAQKIMEWLKRGKKGKAPGLDGINLELLTQAPPKLTDELTVLVEEVWRKNEIPEDWNMTIQIPIPKIKKPSEPNEYRRISLCSVLYKLIAKHILEFLDKTLPCTPSYQAAFLPERSTDDHLFTAGRILEERWRSGQRTFVLALDLTKAFPSVKHEAIVAILKSNKVPHKVINRIIKACLNEETALQWYGTRTKVYKKGKGLKQGCPLSPRLFNLVMNEILMTMEGILGFPDLEQKDKLSLPMILVFADDILIIADKEEILQQMINELIQLCESVGLSINREKSHVLIRDPGAILQPISNLSIQGKKVETVRNLKYLGVQITSKLDRRVNINERIKKAYKIMYSMLPFFRKVKLPWKLTRKIYNLYIVPAIIYGLKTMVLNKNSRSKLRETESNIVRALALTCNPRVKEGKVLKLLEGRTIIRKISALRIRFWGHIIRRSEGHILKRLLKYQSSKKKVGRPCHTWLTNLDKDKERFEVEEEEWENILKDKAKTAITSNELFKDTANSDSEEEDKIKLHPKGKDDRNG